MPLVLREWGLEPVTDPSEAAMFDDQVHPASEAKAQTPIADGEIVDVEEEWFDGDGTIYLIWGILNPNGPTLYCLGSKDVNGSQRVFYRWLHMLGGCTTYAANGVEQCSYQDIIDSAVAIHNHLVGKDAPGLLETIPQFLISSGGDDTLIEIAMSLLTNGPAADEDWGKELAYLRTFGTNFFARTGSEIRSFYEEEKARLAAEGEHETEGLKLIEIRYGHLPEFQEAKIPEFEPSPMTAELLEEWWSIVNAPEFRESAIGTLANMWKGAISVLPEDMQAETVPFDRVVDLLASYGFELSH